MVALLSGVAHEEAALALLLIQKQEIVEAKIPNDRNVDRVMMTPPLIIMFCCNFIVTVKPGAAIFAPTIKTLTNLVKI